LFENPKIIYPDIAKESRATLDREGFYCSNTAYFIPTENLYLLGILNSKIVFTYFKQNASVLGDAEKGGRLRWFRQDVLKIPIRKIDISDPNDLSQYDLIVTLVGQILELKNESGLKSPC
jgi:hypothetical protein